MIHIPGYEKAIAEARDAFVSLLLKEGMDLTILRILPLTDQQMIRLNLIGSMLSQTGRDFTEQFREIFNFAGLACVHVTRGVVIPKVALPAEELLVLYNQEVEHAIDHIRTHPDEYDILSEGFEIKKIHGHILKNVQFIQNAVKEQRLMRTYKDNLYLIMNFSLFSTIKE